MEYTNYIKNRIRKGDAVIYRGTDKKIKEGKVVGIKEDTLKIRENTGGIIQVKAHGVIRKFED